MIWTAEKTFVRKGATSSPISGVQAGNSIKIGGWLHDPVLFRTAVHKNIGGYVTIDFVAGTATIRVYRYSMRDLIDGSEDCHPATIGETDVEYTLLGVQAASVGVGSGAESREERKIQCSISPNPFNMASVISYEGVSLGEYDLEIIDARGRVLRQWRGEVSSNRSVKITWDGAANDGSIVPSGVYCVVMSAGRDRHVDSVTLVK